jgi:hypothetical protein
MHELASFTGLPRNMREAIFPLRRRWAETTRDHDGFLIEVVLPGDRK